MIKIMGITVALVSILSEVALASSEILAVQIDDMVSKTRVSVDLTEMAEHAIFTLSTPDRVVLDIQSARVSDQALPLPVGRGVIAKA